MSRENVEVVRRAFEALVSGGLEKAAEHLHPEVEYVEDPLWPEAATYKGRAAVVACFQRYWEALGAEEEWTRSLEKIVDGGDRQVLLVRAGSRGTRSGAPHEHLWGYVVAVVDRRVSYLRAYYDAAEALEAVGLRE